MLLRRISRQSLKKYFLRIVQILRELFSPIFDCPFEHTLPVLWPQHFKFNKLVYRIQITNSWPQIVHFGWSQLVTDFLQPGSYGVVLPHLLPIIRTRLGLIMGRSIGSRYLRLFQWLDFPLGITQEVLYLCFIWTCFWLT